MSILREIRSQHRRIHLLIPRLYNRENSPLLQSDSALQADLSEILALVRENFASEERILEALRHSAIAQQRNAHREILAGLMSLRERQLAGVRISTAELRHALDAFLIHGVVDDWMFDRPLPGPLRAFGEPLEDR